MAIGLFMADDITAKTIKGTITDPSGTPVSGCLIQATNDGSEYTKSVYGALNGAYEIKTGKEKFLMVSHHGYMSVFEPISGDVMNFTLVPYTSTGVDMLDDLMDNANLIATTLAASLPRLHNLQHAGISDVTIQQHPDRKEIDFIIKSDRTNAQLDRYDISIAIPYVDFYDNTVATLKQAGLYDRFLQQMEHTGYRIVWCLWSNPDNAYNSRNIYTLNASELKKNRRPHP